MVIIRIQRPSTRMALTALNDCEPPETCITARVRPCVGRTPPSLSGIQSIWLLITPLMRAVPLRAAPDLALRPERELAQLRDLGMVLGGAVRQRQAARVEDAHLAAHARQQPRRPPAPGTGCRSARAASRRAAGSAADAPSRSPPSTRAGSGTSNRSGSTFGRLRSSSIRQVLDASIVIEIIRGRSSQAPGRKRAARKPP